MMVTQTGALELYAVHDTPKQSSWSSRCDMLIGTGRSLLLLPAFQGSEPIPEPWETKQGLASPRSRVNSEHSQDVPSTRGRVHSRGHSTADNHEFPPLSPKSKLNPSVLNASRNVSATSKHSMFYHFDYSRGDDRRSKPVTKESEGNEFHPSAKSARGYDFSLDHPIRGIQRVVEEDISNMMRLRAIHGYGLGKVSM